MIHFLFIPIIVVVLSAFYATFFTKDYVKKMWEGSKYLPFLPEEFNDFVPVFKVIIVFTLISVIALYILVLVGITG